MGIRSNDDWSGTIVNGVTLGEPAVRGDGSFEWDGGVPNGETDTDGVFTPDGLDTVPVPLTDLADSVPEWKQPEGAHDAYPAKTVVEHGGKRWVSLTPANVWEPGVSGWRQFSENVSTIFPWIQPTGAHDAYRLGAKVTHNGFTWENTGSDANVWEPGIFGWVKI